MESRLIVEGGNRLSGEVAASGAKNAILPILAATILLDGETKLLNIPLLGDVKFMIRMLNALNIRVEYGFKDDVHIINTKKIRHIAPYELVTSMRASFFVAGPLLAKTGFAKVPLPGGCSIGLRPVDLHLKGFEAMGAEVSIEHGFVQIKADKLKGCPIRLAFPSVGATENLIMAASLAEGETIIDNVAREPEIDDLAYFLIKAGAKIEGIGTSTIHIRGVSSLHGVNPYAVIPDRVEVATLLVAAAMTQGDITITHACPEHLTVVLHLLKEMGLHIETTKNTIRCIGSESLKPADITTEPYPGFPTDIQAQLMSLLTIIPGKSIVKETIFENRFMHAHELVRMGANIKIDGRHAIINGVQHLSGAEVKMTDLRAGAALVLAALSADGSTNIHGLKHLNRGYFDLVGKLRILGAEIYS